MTNVTDKTINEKKHQDDFNGWKNEDMSALDKALTMALQNKALMKEVYTAENSFWNITMEI